MKVKELLNQNPDAEIVIENGELVFKNPEHKPQRWKPRYKDAFYSILACGKSAHYIWHDSQSNEGCFKIGNCFRTEEEAERAVETLKVRAEMLDLGGRTEFKPGDVNWVLEFNPSFPRVEYNYYFYTCYPFGIYFDNREEAENAVQTIGESRIKKYLFGVEEETNEAE